MKPTKLTSKPTILAPVLQSDPSSTQRQRPARFLLAPPTLSGTKSCGDAFFLITLVWHGRPGVSTRLNVLTSVLLTTLISSRLTLVRVLLRLLSSTIRPKNVLNRPVLLDSFGTKCWSSVRKRRRTVLPGRTTTSRLRAATCAARST